MYTDDKTAKYEKLVAETARLAMRAARPMEGPLKVSLTFRLPMPKSMTKRLRAAVLSGEAHYLGAYDADNLAKSQLDGMNGVVFVDDKQVVDLHIVKRGAEKPGVDVEVSDV